MRKLYKEEGGRLLYREAWVEGGEGIVHHGAVGKRGKSERHELTGSEKSFLSSFTREAKSAGYSLIPAKETFWLVVQFPMKSKMGAKRDRWLKETVSEHLNDELGWKGLGHVDGHDIGNFKLNVFCVVVDAELAVAAAKSRLRTSRLDLNRARIATKSFDGDDEYELRFSKKAMVDFSVV